MSTDTVPVLGPICEDDRRIAGTAEYLLQPLANYGVRQREHYTDYEHYVPRTGKRTGGFTRCKCGQEFRTANGRGLHQAAADKRAAKLFDREAATARLTTPTKEGH